MTLLDDIPTVEELFAEKDWWEEADWPATKGIEQLSKFMEDLRKRIWLLNNRKAGKVNVLQMWGKAQLDTANQEVTYMPYNHGNWSGSWSFPDEIEPGELIVYFEDSTGHCDLYVNDSTLTQGMIVLHPPVTLSGQLDIYWRLYPNPNLYHHSDYNAGRPVIGADGRWIIRHHQASAGNYEEYTCMEKSHRWYPRQTDFLCQIPPYKMDGIVNERISKLEIDELHINQQPRTHFNRSVDTASYEPYLKGRRLNEYVLEYGEPFTPEEPDAGQDYIEPLMNEAYQDQVIRTCEALLHLCWPADQDWKDNFVHYSAEEWDDDRSWAFGAITYVSDYNPEGTYPESCFYICKQAYTATPGDPKTPGTAAGEDYWSTPAYDPRYTLSNIEFPHCQDVWNDAISTGNYVDTLLSSGEYWDCNGSAFEFFLKNLGEYDWWWDESFPYVPWWMYKFRHDYPSLIYQMPKPRGCWRRCFKHSMSRVGSMLMWPGELGYPPGYWEGRDEDYKRLENRFIVTQDKYEQITSDTYSRHYRVVDVEGLYAQRAAELEALYGEGYIDRLLERHEEKEINHDLLNHLRYVLVQCRYWFEPVEVTLYRYYGTIVLASEDPSQYYGSTSLEAYQKAKDAALQSSHLTYEGTGTYAYIGKTGEVYYDVDHWEGWLTGEPTKIRYGLLYAKLHIGDEREFQDLPTIGKAMFHFRYEPTYECVSDDPAEPNVKREPCAVGDPNKPEDAVKPDCSVYGTVGWYGFMATPPAAEGWFYNFSTSKWEYRVQWWIMPTDEWPPDTFFTGVDSPKYAQWIKSTKVNILSSTVPSVTVMDFDNTDESVFEKDLTNYIEV